jgi:sensor histidine kinase regulating citrate/malate metabolism
MIADSADATRNGTVALLSASDSAGRLRTRDLVKKHRGKLTVEHPSEGGTAMIIEVPWADGNPE